jgi:hypothetical protein
MKLHYFAKGELSIHDLIQIVMPAHIAAGGDPQDFSPVSRIQGQLVTTGCYDMLPIPYRQKEYEYIGWQLRRAPGTTIAEILEAVPEISEIGYRHELGLNIADKVRFQVNEAVVHLVEGLIAHYGRKSYQVNRDGKTVTIIADVFLQEHLPQWAIESALKADSSESFTFAHSLDSRGGRQYPSTAGVKNWDGRMMRSFPTMQTGEASALLRLADPIEVSREYCEKVWIPSVIKEFKVTKEQVFDCMDAEKALAFVTSSSSPLKGIGKKKRNMLGFLAQCLFIKEALDTGASHGYMPSLDGHANGWLSQHLAYGDESLKQVLVNGDQYRYFISAMARPSTGIAEVDNYLLSRDWMKAASTPAMYTSRFLAPVFVYGPASDVELGCLPEDFVCNHEIQRDRLNPQLPILATLKDHQILQLAEKASDMALAAMYSAAPRTMAVVDTWLKKAKAIHKDGRVIRTHYAGFEVTHFSAAPALEWFPADEKGDRNLPTVSITIPTKYREYFESRKWPTRYQPTCAPFVKGTRDEDGNPVLPYQPSGEINTTHTPNGSSVRLVSLCDGHTLTDTICQLGNDFVASRHDAITVRPTEAYMDLPRMYTKNMWHRCCDLRNAIAEVIGDKDFGPMMAKDEFLSHSANVMK